MREFRAGLLVLACGSLAGFALAGGAAETASGLPAGVKKDTYMGWQNAVYLDAEGAETRVVVVPEVGGRVMRYQFVGENVFWENSRTFGLTTMQTKDTFLPGGYQLDVGPESNLIPDRKLLWNGPYQVKSLRDYGVTLVSEPDSETGLQLEKEILLEAESGETGVIQRVKNISGQEQKTTLRARIFCKGGGYVVMGLNKYSRHPAGWGLRHLLEDKIFYDHYKPTLPQVKVLDRFLIADTTPSVENKIGADSDSQWLAYANGRTLFVVYFPFEYTNKYGGDGHTVQAWWNGVATELHVLSPEITLQPGETYSFPIKWSVITLKDGVTNHKQAKAAVAKLPPSPFRAGLK